MITPVLELIRSELEAFFTPQFTDEAPEIVLDKLMTRSGKSTIPEDEDRVVITLLNLEEERNTNPGRTSDPGNAYCFNLCLLFSVYEREKERDKNDYIKCIKYLDLVLRYFQQNTVMTPQSQPQLPEGVQHLQFNLMNESLRETSYIWTMTGAKHAPSVMYQVRSVAVGDRLKNRISGVMGGVSIL